MEPSHTQWLIPFAVQLIPAGMLLIGAIWLPESPRWLFSKNRREQAIKGLCWMRNLDASHPYMIEEMRYIDEDNESFRREVGAGFWKPFKALKDHKTQWRFAIGALLFVFQNGKLARPALTATHC
jgi:hypothetical protein